VDANPRFDSVAVALRATTLQRLTLTLLATGLILLGTLAFLPPQTQALPATGDWAVEQAGGTTVNNFGMDGGNNKVGIAYEGLGILKLGFTLKTGSGLFATKTADVSGSNLRLDDPDLVFLGGSTWVVAAKNHANSDLLTYRTTDDGATWTLVNTLTSTSAGSDWGGGLAHFGANVVGITYMDTAGNVLFEQSTDGGLTWSNGSCLTDNASTPNLACQATHIGVFNSDIGYEQVIVGSTPTYRVNVVFTTALGSPADGKMFGVWTTGPDANFWTIPYTADGGSSATANVINTVAHAGGSSAIITNGGIAEGYEMTTSFADSPTTGLDNYLVNEHMPASGGPAITTTSFTSGATNLNQQAGVGHARPSSNGVTELVPIFRSDNQLDVWMRTGTTGAFTSAYQVTGCSTCNVVASWMNDTVAYVAYKNPGVSNIVVIHAPVGAQGILPTATVSVSALSAMDVDPTGTIVIARTNSGATVRTFSGSTLVQAASKSTNCASDDNYGVTALQANTAFVTCNASTHLADQIEVRNANLLNPSRPSRCDSNHPLDDSSYNLALNSTLDDTRMIQSFKILSIDFENSDNSLSGSHEHCRAQYGMAASTNTGLAGVITFDSDHPFFEAGNTQGTPSSAFALFDPTAGPVDEVCINILNPQTPADPTGWHLFAADSQANTKEFLFNQDVDDPQIAEIHSFGGAFNGAMGVGCNKREIVVVETSGGQVAAYNLTSGTQPWTAKTVVSPKFRGLTAALDAQVFAYVDGSRAYVAGMGNGTVLCMADLPSGTFKDIRLTDKAQNMYIATDVAIDKYPLSSCVGFQPETNGYPISSFTTTGTTDVSIGPNGECLTVCPGGVIATGVSLPLGWTIAAFNAFLGVILMGALGGGMWGAFGRHWAALVIGSIMGFILALIFHLFSLWTLILVVVVAVAIIFIGIKRAAGGSTS